MMGKNHIISNTCSVVSLCSIGYLLDRLPGPVSNLIDLTLETIKNTVIAPHQGWFYYPLSVGLFYLGTLLPDIDNSKSTLGRFLYLPIEHRTWTHAIWFPIILVIVSYWYRPLFWLSFGYFLHLFWDNFSAAGNCFLYPISNYRRYPNYAKVKKGHWFKLYRAGELSETIVVVMIVVFTILLSVFCLVSRFQAM